MLSPKVVQPEYNADRGPQGRGGESEEFGVSENVLEDSGQEGFIRRGGEMAEWLKAAVC